MRAITAVELEAKRIGRLLDAQRVRRHRGILEHYSQELSNSATIQYCGRKRQWTGGQILGAIDVHIVRDPDGLCRFQNVSSCGSVWECPSCMQKITARRAGELRELVAKHRSEGGGAYMLTLTVPHDAGDELEQLRRTIAKTWQYCIAGAPWKRIKKSIGFVGFVRALELTHGVNHWHPHLHVLVLTERPLECPATGMSLPSLLRFKRMMYCRWARKISSPREGRTGRRARRGSYRLPTYRNGISLVRSNKDDYIAKMGLADEIARGSTRKRGRAFGAHRSPLEILGDIARRHTLKCYDAVLWKEYGRCMKGARQLTYSRGVRDRYDLRPEQTDLELVEQLDRKLGEFVDYIPGKFWDSQFMGDPESRLNVREAAELEGADGVRAVLTALGYSSAPRWPEPPSPEVRPIAIVDPQLTLIPAG